MRPFVGLFLSASDSCIFFPLTVTVWGFSIGGVLKARPYICEGNTPQPLTAGVCRSKNTLSVWHVCLSCLVRRPAGNLRFPSSSSTSQRPRVLRKRWSNTRRSVWPSALLGGSSAARVTASHFSQRQPTPHNSYSSVRELHQCVQLICPFPRPRVHIRKLPTVIIL